MHQLRKTKTTKHSEMNQAQGLHIQDIIKLKDTMKLKEWLSVRVLIVEFCIVFIVPSVLPLYFVPHPNLFPCLLMLVALVIQCLLPLVTFLAY